MPQRFLRPGITNSERWNSVSFECQSFYIRILTHVDDYGRFDGRPSVLHGHCFSVWNERNPDHQINLQQVDAMLQQLSDTGLIDWYDVEGKKVVQFVQWQERIRENTKSKWPERTEVAATCCNLLRPTPSPTPSPTSSTAPDVASLPRSKTPSIEEIKLQAAKIGLSDLEAEKFFNYYESNGWRVGRNPMKSWTHALTNWKNNAATYTVRNPAKNDRNFGMPTTAAQTSARIVAELKARGGK